MADPIEGDSKDPTRAGVTGKNSTATEGMGVFGQGFVGVQGMGAGGNVPGIGVLGSAWGAKAAGVKGVNIDPHGLAGDFQGSVNVTATTGEGVFGQGGTNGVHGKSASEHDSGVWGENTGSGYGVAGTSVSGTGVYGRGSPAGNFEGNVNVTGNITVGGDVLLQNKDCAEDFEMTGDVEPGVVVVIDPSGNLRQCETAYDKRVAGVVSGAGDYRPGIILGRQQPQGNKLPVALLGRVHCKVDARYSPIEVGDLLTTSPTPGHAMLANDAARAFGTVIGKALQPVAAGQALIPILVALQ